MLEKGFGESLFLEHNINSGLFGFQHYLEYLLLKLCWRHTQYPENLKTTSCNLKMGSMTPETVGRRRALTVHACSCLCLSAGPLQTSTRGC